VNTGCRPDSGHCTKHISGYLKGVFTILKCAVTGEHVTQITMNRAQSYLVLKCPKATEIQHSRFTEEFSVLGATVIYYLSCPEKLNIHLNFYFRIL
jgi:hypothetical protein